MRASLALSCALLAVLGLAPPSEPPLRLVACAPGYPGSTAQAQPTMDELAALVASAAGWSAERIAAEYHAEEADGVARLRQSDAALGLVPLPFYLKYAEPLGLRPLLQAAQSNGRSTERWSLVAPAGRIARADDLDGWEIAGIAAYAPGFVRGVALASWGRLPDGVEIVFTHRVLRAIRRAIQGEPVALLLDGAQTAALSSLPGAERLEVVAVSPPLPTALLVTVADRLPANAAGALREALTTVHERADLAATLSTMRLARFEPVDERALEAARTAFRSDG